MCNKMNMSKIRSVVKLDGSVVPIQFDAILHRIQAASDGLTRVEPAAVAQKVINGMVDCMSTTELDEMAAAVCGHMINETEEYDKLAVRILVSRLHKICTPTFSGMMHALHSENLVTDEFFSDVMHLVESVDLDMLVERSHDFRFTYFGLCTLLRNGYLLSTVSKHLQELPCYMYMRLAVFLHGRNLAKVIAVYNSLSHHEYIHASPTLFHAGTPLGTLISCFLLSVNDDIRDIAAMQAKCMLISKGAGGIGVNMSLLRGRGSLIHSTGGTSNGILPWMKILQEVAKAVNQGGKRPGSIAVYLEPWHCDIEEFLDARLPTTHDDLRTDRLFTALWANDLFIERVIRGGTWSLMCPNECPGLVDAHCAAFEQLYTDYERAGKFRKQLPAQELWNKMLKSLIETGTPYILAKDTVNRKNAQANRGTIRGSNLCAEIVEYSSNDEVACCNLASIRLSAFYDPECEDQVDFERLRQVAGELTENLNQVIDKTVYPHPEAQESNRRMRPIAIGVQGLADLFQLLKVPFSSEAAAKLNARLFETIYFGAVQKSVELAKRDGPYPDYAGSPWSRGQFQFDLWEQWYEFKSSCLMHDWSGLRAKMQQHGIRNSLITSIMPTASTAQILGSTECIEPPHSNFYSRRVKSGEFMIFNKHLMAELERRGMWDDAMRDAILDAGGSVQHIDRIPDEVKQVYLRRTEVKQRVLIDLAAGRGPFIDQTQSMNMFFEVPSPDHITAALVYAWKRGLKTLIYYNRTQSTVTGVTTREKKEPSNDQTQQREARRLQYLAHLAENPGDQVCTSCTG
jgi:ribonucleoside-diphosphate reductase alpha chain